ncbi:bifunctional adenosylcobinamide kinase/adenosylcobinamide-phosphate guanylyltransferase [Hoeflea sp.]|uniref:bifunctional adenosylcobinamide kinase/adenosylcobinamide-phosphate guanylyltransferase n=1 Tax=Hoeflea sp. TaxID=1940281 RepID=UPI003B02B3B8
MTSPSGTRCVLVLGGARSGKSAFAEAQVEKSGLEAVYLATGRSFDAEMDARIRQHQARRGSQWRTIEEPLSLAETLAEHSGDDKAVLVDCLTLWVTNLMMAERDVAQESSSLAACLGDCRGLVVLVSNEVGLGIVPDNAMARAFRDHAGRLHQMIAAHCDEVYLLAAGLPLKMKG